MNNKELYSDRLNKGNRTYFFDINESTKGDLYLTVSESKKIDSCYERQKLLIFEDDMKDFVETFRRILVKYKDIREQKKIDVKSDWFEKVRQTYKNAGVIWTAEDDSKLEDLFRQGKKAKELSKIFKRNETAISFRIKKLGLCAKYRH